MRETNGSTLDKLYLLVQELQTFQDFRISTVDEFFMESRKGILIPISLRPSKPNIRREIKNHLILSTWIYTAGQYLSPSQLFSPDSVISSHKRIAFASPFRNENAVV